MLLHRAPASHLQSALPIPPVQPNPPPRAPLGRPVDK